MNEKKESGHQPRRKFASSKKKLALQIGIILLYFLFIGYCGRQNESVSDWLFAFLLVSLLAGFLLWRQRPVWVELYEDKMCYRSFLGKQQEFFYTQMQSIDFVKKMYTVGMIVPIYGYTKYSIYLEENGKKKKLNMNSLSCDDFVMIWRTFLERGETREDKELCENMKTPYFYKSFSVPTKKLKDTYYYIGKKVGIVIAAAYFVLVGGEVLCEIIQNISRMSVSEWITNAVVNLLLFVAFFLIFYFPVRRFLYRKEIAASKKVPKEVYVCNDHLEIDGIKYAFEKINGGLVVSSRFHCDRMIKFTYEGKVLQFNFGKYHRFLPDYFKEYKTLELYLRGRGFERWIQ